MTALAGSPPHVRGPPMILYHKYTVFGITPACAGTTKLWRNILRKKRDHPRMCGDHQATFTDPRVISGSPPHVRGPHRFRVDKRKPRGITPACAGTTNIFHMKALACGDHPRMCGDHAVFWFRAVSPRGSPPHVRGPQKMATIFKKYDGITPACAGTT